MGTKWLSWMLKKIFYRISQPIRRIVIFSFKILEKRKNNDECILTLVIYWKKTGLLCAKLATIIQ
jgi:hypothetical protein